MPSCDLETSSLGKKLTSLLSALALALVSVWALILVILIAISTWELVTIECESWDVVLESSRIPREPILKRTKKNTLNLAERFTVLLILITNICTEILSRNQRTGPSCLCHLMPCLPLRI